MAYNPSLACFVVAQKEKVFSARVIEVREQGIVAELTIPHDDKNSPPHRIDVWLEEDGLIYPFYEDRCQYEIDKQIHLKVLLRDDENGFLIGKEVKINEDNEDEEETESMNQTYKLYWKMPADKFEIPASKGRKAQIKEPKKDFVKNLRSCLKNCSHDYFKNLLKEDDTTLIQEFLDKFFLNGFNEPILACLANASIQQLDNYMHVLIRIPNHPEFSNLLPKQKTFALIGHVPLNNRYLPILEPKNIYLTHNSACADYEVFKEVIFSNQNVANDTLLTKDFINELPPFARESAKRLKDWENFIAFKENYTKQITFGVRYIGANLREDLEILVVLPKKYVDKSKRIFANKTLSIFTLNASNHPLYFEIKKEKEVRSFNLGDFKSIQEIPEKDLTEDLIWIYRDFEKSYQKEFEECQEKYIIEERGYDKDADKETIEKYVSKSYEGNDFNTLKEKDNLILAKIRVELDENIPSKTLKKFKKDDKQDNKEKYNDKNIEENEEEDTLSAKSGFVALSLLGDIALNRRHKIAIRDLKQNQNCASPYLSTYLFDIQNANTPKEIEKIKEWHNPNLNESQKIAIEKLMNAPDIAFLQGPPGTGKTTVIAEIIMQCVKDNKSVLLSSQSHDAVDNALARIDNDPSIRLLRLARDESKIAEEAKHLVGDKALTHYYKALDTHTHKQYIEPSQNYEKEIKFLDEWLKKARFLEHDRSDFATELETQKGELINKENELSKASKDLEKEQELYDKACEQHQKLLSLVSFLENNSSYLDCSCEFPSYAHSLAKLLCNLKKCVCLNLSFSYAEFLAQKEAQMYAFKSAYEKYHALLNFKEQMILDNNRLKSSSNALDMRTKLEIENLEKENKILEHKEDMNEEDFKNYKANKKKIQELKNKSGALSDARYNMFSDSKNFLAPIENENDTLRVQELLKERLKTITALEKQIEQEILKVKEQIKGEIKPQAPNECVKNTLENELRVLKEEIKARQDKLVHKNKERHEHKEELKELEFDVLKDFTSLLKECENFKLELEQKLSNFKKENSDFSNLFKEWHKILNEPFKAQVDFKELKESYIESCNVIAFSCNENLKTLRDNNLDSFDVAIIDEVSKATPLELLNPLMLARKAILIGDHQQLPPVFENSIDALEDKIEESIEEQEETKEADVTALSKENFERYKDLVSASLFKEWFENAPESLKASLTTQYRMHPSIMHFVNYFYHNKLTCGNPKKDRSHFIELSFTSDTGNKREILNKNTHFLWVDTSKDTQDKEFQATYESKLEATLIAKSLLEINKQIAAKNLKLEVGVVSFYVNQCKLIKKEIRKLNNGSLNFKAISVHINSVIRYQGKEKDIILMSVVRNEKLHKNSKAYIARYEFINVAMSRAKNLLIVFGAKRSLENLEVKLPKDNSKETIKKQVYKNMFKDLELEKHSQAKMCDAKRFSQIFNHNGGKNNGK
ncbi:DEAD/DEAH box helicase [Helicobacter cetorum]|uniref:Superfamily I DNA/RNA helicase n=1 Tax=Helicobacter cetorum (strain ATCC BAA-429 / MIT 00-7128) TaxID=182217 RepID=I0ELU8_HELC0|nr:AAA domain-containing protein [Helicobacter cetorum]AFI03917.1 superfamily I DNA/RNA helicase [Helicobacter cetorum MIT 00-7128]